MGNKKSELLEEIQEFLGLEQELPLIESYDKLKLFRNENHPDKYQDDTLKKAAEDKFKKANSLLEAVRKQIEKNKLDSNSSELVLYKPLFDHFAKDQELEDANRRIKELEEEASKLKQEIASLEEELQLQSSKNLSNDLKELQEMYKPSKKRILTIGIAIVLTSLLLILSKVDELSSLFGKYSPLNEPTFNIIVFSILSFTLIVTLKNYVERLFIKKRASEITSPIFIKEFMNKVRSKEMNEFYLSSNKFLESHVFEHIYGKYTTLKKILRNCGFLYFQYGTTDQLKNIFIDNLLNKKLIEISIAKELDRVFIVKDE